MTATRLEPRTTSFVNGHLNIWPDGWVFVYELSVSGFESSCSHLTFRFRSCFEQGVPWHSSNFRAWIHSETRAWHDKIIQSEISQPACNIPEILGECSLSVALFRASREYLRNILKENIFKKVLDGKVVFVLKVCDLTKTNVDLLTSSSNYKAMFLEYSQYIPRISISKMFQGYCRNILKLWKCFYEVKKFCGLSFEIFFIGSFFSWNVFLNFIETVFYWEQGA